MVGKNIWQKNSLKIGGLLFVLALSFMGLGCAGEQMNLGGDSTSSDDSDAPLAPDDGTDVSSTGTSKWNGGTVDFEPDSVAIFEEYLGRLLNDPSKFKITVDLNQKETNTYAGTMRISFVDNSKFQYNAFSTGTGKVNVSASKYDGLRDYVYNNWVVYNNEDAFRAYFQDQLGAVIFVVDDTLNLGDGGGVEDSLNGKVYFKNFESGTAPLSPTKCWFVTLGPYQCRTVYNTNNNYIYPLNGYQLLGTFKGLSRTKAFNED